MKKAIIIILAALLMLSVFVACNQDDIIDDILGYSVTFDANGGEGTMESQKIPADGADLNANAFAYTDHTFKEWNTKADGTGTAYKDKGYIKLTSSITLYAQWKHNEAKIAFSANGGEGSMATLTVKTNSPVELPVSTLSWDGHVFYGWNTKADGSGTFYGDGAVIYVAADTILYAQWWQPTVSFDANGGTGSMPDQAVDYDVATALSPIGTSIINDGYSFVEWNTKADGTGIDYEDGDDITTTEDVTLYAQWTANTYIVSFDANGGSEVKTTIEVYYGSEYGELPDTIKGGSEFSGWFTEDGTLVTEDTIVTIAKDHVLTAYWDAMSYKISYETNGGTINSGKVEEYTYGIGATLPTDVTKDGNEFGGWYKNAEFKGKVITEVTGKEVGDKTFYARWLVVYLDDKTTEWTDGYTYTLADGVTALEIPNRITVTGDVTLLLPDGATLTASSGITVSKGNSLTITVPEESEGTGILIATAGDAYAAGIGGEYDATYPDKKNAGIITIEGGTVTAEGGEASSGIGGSYEGDCGIITINDGTVFATGNSAAGIGGGYYAESTGKIVINGGTVTAIGGTNAAGIGGAEGSDGGIITITGGTVTSTGNNYGAGIGGGDCGAGGTITISGESTEVTATGGEFGAGIGGGCKGNGGIITISGGTVQATSADAEGIGKGVEGEDGTLEIGTGMGLYGGVDDENIEFLSEPTEEYDGPHPVYMEAKPTTYAKVTFDANTGTGKMDPQTVPVGTGVPLNANTFEHATLFFDGWALTPDAEKAEYADKAKFNAEKDTTLYAHWIDIIYLKSTDTTLEGGKRYSIEKNLEITNRLTVTGTEPVTLILPDDLTLTASEGINVKSGTSLFITVPEDSKGTGALVATTTAMDAAGIGGNEAQDAGSITINGGTVTATGDSWGAGIGGGYRGDGGTVIISGKGTVVTATGGSNAAGIGGGFDGEGGDVTINGGTVTATGKSGATGIGSGVSSGAELDKGTLAIGNDVGLYGGADKDHTKFISAPTDDYKGDRYAYMESKATTYVTVTFDGNGATSGTMEAQLVPSGVKAKLHANAFKKAGSFFVSWNTQADGKGIPYSDKAQVTLSANTTLYAQWVEGTDLNSMDDKYTWTTGNTYVLTADLTLDQSRVTISGDAGTVKLVLLGSNKLSAAKGIIVNSDYSLIIEGTGTLSSSGSEGSAGIGGEYGKAGGNVTIKGGTIIARGSTAGGAGIGGGQSGDGGTITISGGNVTATGGDSASGIGGGYEGSGGIVIINGGTVTATGNGGDGIGSGYNGENGTLTIGTGMGLYGGDDKDHTEFISGPITEYDGDRYQYMNAEPTEYVTVTFDANTGMGSMDAQSVPSGVDVALNANEYTKTDNSFTGWNTKSDGSGKAYSDKATINITENTTLYAQWIQGIDLNNMTDDKYEWTDGNTYVVTDDLPLNAKRIIVSGTVKLYLLDGVTLTTRGITVTSGKTLTIDGEGTLISQGIADESGIGGGPTQEIGTIIIDGGTIIATGGNGGAGIGGGSYGDGGTVIINGGTVSATGKGGGSGIGRGIDGTDDGKLTIGTGMGLYGGADDETAVFLSGTTDPETGYTGERPVYMEAEAITYVNVTFNANGGKGTMDAQAVPTGKKAKLNSNEFTHDTLYFAGWNTKADGTGTSYTDNGIVDLNSDLELFAVWRAKFTVDRSTVVDSKYRQQSVVTNPASIPNESKYVIVANGPVYNSSGVKITSVSGTGNWNNIAYNNNSGYALKASGSGDDYYFDPETTVTIVYLAGFGYWNAGYPSKDLMSSWGNPVTTSSDGKLDETLFKSVNGTSRWWSGSQHHYSVHDGWLYSMTYKWGNYNKGDYSECFVQSAIFSYSEPN